MIIGRKNEEIHGGMGGEEGELPRLKNLTLCM